MLKDTGIINALIIWTIFIKSALDPKEPEGMRERERETEREREECFAHVWMWQGAWPPRGPGAKEGFSKLPPIPSNPSHGFSIR